MLERVKGFKAGALGLSYLSYIVNHIYEVNWSKVGPVFLSVFIMGIRF